MKAPRTLKQKIRAEIFTCLISGQYQNKDHILGEIAYVDFIEKENKSKYLERIKNYIGKQLVKIQLFPELVMEYNNNKFYEDLPLAISIDINIVTEEDFDDIECLFRERKNFLQKNGIKDICKYSKWPDIIINSSYNIAENIADIECPF